MRFILPGLILLAICFLPEPVMAQIVQCGGEGQARCDACSFVGMVNRIVNFLITLMVMLAVVLIAVAGIRLVVSGGDTSALQKAKDAFGNVVIGFVIVLGAWLLVDTIMELTTGRGLEAWGIVDCGFEAVPGITTGADANLQLVNRPSAGCPTCVEVPSGITCKNNRSCTIQADYAERLAGLARVHEFDLEVTEGFPPTRTHKAACHGDGTCVDIVFKDRVWTEERVRAFQAQASALGFRAVYEPGPGESCLNSSNCVSGVATGNHFSLYPN